MGDFNDDDTINLAIGAENYVAATGQVHFFYNDGSMPTESTSDNATIIGESATSLFGHAFTAGDFNSDGKNDLVASAYY